MKIIRTIIPVLCALILFSCADNSQKEIVFEYDECGVVNKINPDENASGWSLPPIIALTITDTSKILTE